MAGGLSTWGVHGRNGVGEEEEGAGEGVGGSGGGGVGGGGFIGAERECLSLPQEEKTPPFSF